MLDEFKAKDANDTRQKLEQTLLLGAGVNRMATVVEIRAAR